MTANLQTVLTVKQAATVMNVSERAVYMARELRACRPDLGNKVMAGEMSLLAALKIAKPEKYAKRKDGPAVLLAAWNKATEGERAAFLDAIAPSTGR